jgi:hypothetical protein
MVAPQRSGGGGSLMFGSSVVADPFARRAGVLSSANGTAVTLHSRLTVFCLGGGLR